MLTEVRGDPYQIEPLTRKISIRLPLGPRVSYIMTLLVKALHHDHVGSAKFRQSDSAVPNVARMLKKMIQVLLKRNLVHNLRHLSRMSFAFTISWFLVDMIVA